MKRLYLLVFFMLVILFCSCSSVTTVATSGAQAVYNRHSIKETLNDHYITMQAYKKIYNDDNPRFKNTSVGISTFHGEVLLTGEIPDKNDRKEIENLVHEVHGIKKVYNLTQISPPLSALKQASDAWITTKIRTKLLAMDEVDPSQIKVITENGTVFLMGIVPPEQAEATIQMARTTNGVQNVVKIFSYLRISKT